MKIKIGKFLAISMLILSGILFLKFINLYARLGNLVDGEGIGIYLFGFEINDKVKYSQISSYANRFLVYSLSLLAFALFIIKLIKKTKLDRIPK